METFLFLFEMLGTIAFAASGAVLGVRKGLDVFGVCFLGLFNCQSQSRRFFRVGRNNGREVAAYYVLFGYMDDIRETECFQCRRDNRHACSVDRRVDDLHVMVTCDGFR